MNRILALGTALARSPLAPVLAAPALILVGALAAPATTLAGSGAPADDPPPAPGERPAEPVAEDEVHVLARPAIIGASASAGFGIEDEVGVRAGLANVLEEMLRVEHDDIVNAATSWLFMDPDGTGTNRVERALKAEPTVLFAVDFLFWFTYGTVDSDDERFELLGRGLELLERFECPVLIGTIPDMSPAVGKMLSRSMVPSPEMLTELNTRIDAWAEARDNVVQVPLADFLDRMRADQRIELRGQVWEAGSSRAMLQSDELHPTLEGLVGLAILTADTLVSAREDLDDETFAWDRAAIYARVDASLEAERQKKADRERRRKEREEKDAQKGTGQDPEKDPASGFGGVRAGSAPRR